MFVKHNVKDKTHTFCIYASNFEEVEGAYWFGPVRPCMVYGVWCVTLCIRSRMVRDRILKFDILNRNEKISGPIFCFFSVELVVADGPFSIFFQLSHCKPMEPCEQNILRTA